MSSPRRIALALLLGLVLANGAAFLAGLGASELLPKADLGATVMRTLVTAAVSFAIVMAIAVAVARGPLRGNTTIRAVAGALLGLAVAFGLLYAGFGVEGSSFWVGLILDEALVTAGAWLLSRPDRAH